MAVFSCGTIDDPHGPTVVWAAGDVDMVTAPRLGAEIEPRLVSGAQVVVHCKAVTFLDSTGVRVLVHARRAAKEMGAQLALAGVPEPVAAVLDAAGVTSLFTHYDTVAEAKADESVHHDQDGRLAHKQS